MGQLGWVIACAPNELELCVLGISCGDRSGLGRLRAHSPDSIAWDGRRCKATVAPVRCCRSTARYSPFLGRHGAQYGYGDRCSDKPARDKARRRRSRSLQPLCHWGRRSVDALGRDWRARDGVVREGLGAIPRSQAIPHLSPLRRCSGWPRRPSHRPLTRGCVLELDWFRQFLPLG